MRIVRKEEKRTNVRRIFLNLLSLFGSVILLGGIVFGGSLILIMIQVLLKVLLGKTTSDKEKAQEVKD